MDSLSVRNMGRMRPPALPFAALAKAIVPRFELSLAFVNEDDARALNTSLRKKRYTPNVLSYEAGKESGEIIICLPIAKKEASTHGLSYRAFVALLFIHACLHLKGRRHGPIMEKNERALLARFVSVPSLHETTNRNRHRPRHASDENRRSRGGTRTRRSPS